MQKSDAEFEAKGVFNPTCVREGGKTHMFYRAMDKNDVSRIGYVVVEGFSVTERSEKPLLEPEYDWEMKGMEDPRVTKFEGGYYMIYTACDCTANSRLAAAVSRDLKNWKKLGLVGPNITYPDADRIIKRWDLKSGYGKFLDWFKQTGSKESFLFLKSGCLLPRRIGGKMAMFIRIHPGIQIVYFDGFEDLKNTDFWRKYLADLKDYVVMDPVFPWEGEVIGTGSVPIETNEGWLVIYYGSAQNGKNRKFAAGSALLDLNNPKKVIGRLREPLLEATEDWEINGRVGNVVFPSGAVTVGEKLWIYYGAADSVVGGAEVNLKELLSEIITG